MADCFIIQKSKPLKQQTNIAEALEAAQDKQNVVWINLLEPTDPELETVEKGLGLHELTTEDLKNPSGRAKIEDFDGHLFMTFKALNFNEGEDIEETINLNFILFKNLLVTVHISPILSIKETMEDIAKRPAIMKAGADFLMYSILDRVIDKYLPIIDQLDDETEQIEESIFEKFDSGVSEKIFGLKQMVAHLRRRVAPQREMLANLSGRQHALIHPKTQIYLRDVYDHIIRVNDNLESYRDILQGAMDSYMTQISNRMNEVMKTLSIIATLMLPLGFLTGLYGTNFELLPGSKGPYNFWIFVGVMVVLILAGVGYFKSKKWF